MELVATRKSTGENMAQPSEQKQIAYLTYHLGIEGVAQLSGDTSTPEARQWIQGVKKPSKEQAKRLRRAYRHLVHINSGQSATTDPKWLISTKIVTLFHDDNFAKIDELAGYYIIDDED